MKHVLVILAFLMLALPSFAEGHEKSTQFYVGAGLGGQFADNESNVDYLGAESAGTWNVFVGGIHPRLTNEHWSVGFETELERSLDDSGMDLHHTEYGYGRGTLRTTTATLNARLFLHAAKIRGKYTPSLKFGVGLMNSETSADSAFGTAGRFALCVDRNMTTNVGFGVCGGYVISDAKPALFRRGSDYYVEPNYGTVNMHLWWATD